MDKIKSIRQNIDNLMLQSKSLSSNRELALAYTNMQRGSMWLGLALKALGTANPYPDSTNTSNEKIEDRTDQAKDSPKSFEQMMETDSRTVIVKWFRGQLDTVADDILAVQKGETQAASHELTLSHDAIREAKMWYGWELNNIHTAVTGE